ncbi:hypothetical protein [Streptomyces sp. NPDC050535]|uniref:SCO2400 family protein n=1 Tax=Streptomyces sp. NPDC050535 TaxID=3365626 RepID=UPI0037A9B1FF
MDYCHPCRRHLNGALACPGCGTPADKVREHADAVESRPEADDDVGESPEGDDAHPRGRRRGVGAGPAGRRDRKAAAHRKRRRGALIAGAGLLLAAGGLSLAELGVEGAGSNPQASKADESPEGGAATPARTARAIDDAAGSDGASASGSPSASSSPSPSASVSASESAAGDEEEQSAPSTQGVTTSAPTSSRPTATSQPPSADPTSADPSPDPSPSETCAQFLWWCT